MKNFKLKGIEFTGNEKGTHFYKIDENGKKVRITKDGFEEALAEYEYEMRKQAEAESEANRLAEAEKFGITVEEQPNGNFIVKLDGEIKTNPVAKAQAMHEVHRLMSIMKKGETTAGGKDTKIETVRDGDTMVYQVVKDGEVVSNHRSVEEAQQEVNKMTAKATKTKKASSRKNKFALTIEWEGGSIGITEKQKDFMEHLKDTNLWEHGLESSLWVSVLCDEIGGQFKGKPLSVGAMISTLREKGLIGVGVGTMIMDDRKKKTKYMWLTEAGKKMARAVEGLE